MQPLASGAKLAAYHARLRGSHDFRIHVDILNLNETPTGSATLIDGQVNIAETGPVRRTLAATLSDPAGALDFSNGSAWSNTHVWVDRLIRVRHVVTVPGYGEVTAVPFVGPPTAISRNGAEVQVDCSDKAALANRGARPYTAAKGANAVTAIRAIMASCTGEFRFRMPSSTRRLSKAYSVGWTDEASPIVIAAAIAKNELGMQLLYSCDGYLMLRPGPLLPVADVGYVTEQANSSADFSAVANYVIVNGKATSKTKNYVTTTTRPVSSAVVGPTSTLAPGRLQRQGVARYLPLIINEDAYTTTTQTATRAKAEVTRAATVTDELTATVVPMFHLDADDVVIAHSTENSSRSTRFRSGSIPLGVGGDMTIGYTAWVSKVAAPKVASHIARSVKHGKRPAKKHGKKHRPRRHHH